MEGIKKRGGWGCSEEESALGAQFLSQRTLK